MQQLSNTERTILEMVLMALRRLREAGLTRAYAVEVEVRGRQIEVKVRSHVVGMTTQDEPVKN